MKSKKGDKTVIRVVRKAKGRWPHNHGTWKVAYADFVTAMMAFFMVMWIVGMETDVKELVQGYFSNPVGFKKSYAVGDNPLGSGASPEPEGTARLSLLARDSQRWRFEELRVRLREWLSGTDSRHGLTTRV